MFNCDFNFSFEVCLPLSNTISIADYSSIHSKGEILILLTDDPITDRCYQHSKQVNYCFVSIDSFKVKKTTTFKVHTVADNQ